MSFMLSETAAIILQMVATPSRRDPAERLCIGPGPHPLLIADDAEMDLAIVPDVELSETCSLV